MSNAKNWGNANSGRMALPATAPRMLLKRFRLPISVRFRLLPPQKGYTYKNPHSLQVRITINGKEDSGFVGIWPLDESGEKLQVNPAHWNVKEQKSTRRDDPVNFQIPALKAHILAIYQRQLKIAFPTIKSVRYELVESISPIYTKEHGWLTSPKATEETPDYHWHGISGQSSLTDVYAAYIKELQTTPITTRQHEITIGRWDRGFQLLTDYTAYTKNPNPPCSKINLNWLTRFHAWMQTQHGGRHRRQKVSVEQASRFIGKVGAVLDYLIREGELTSNPVKSITWERAEDKEILFLEPHHVRHLFTLEWSHTKGTALWWFLLMCCTGLDFPDAQAYVKNRKQYERDSPDGIKLIGRRNKAPHEPFEFYKLNEVDLLFMVHPEGAMPITAHCVNRYTDAIESELGIDWRITNKTARKTFGCLMLASGYYVSEVSRMLGHKRISTTEQHYVKVLGAAVDRGKKRITAAGGNW